jgi:phage tail-like protein
VADRTLPYSAFNFLVDWGGPNDVDSPLGGFSEVSGLGTELTVAEYRNGNDPVNRVRKIPGIHKASDVTLKRGIINSKDFWDWIKEARIDGPAAKRRVKISLLDENRNFVQRWELFDALPLKYTGPTLQAKGGGDVAMEEIVISAETIEVVDS